MKAILIFILLGLTFSYNGEGAAAYAQKYCNNYNPDYNKYTEQAEESANFVSQCMSVGGGQDFEGCGPKDNKGMFKNVLALKNCLIKKGWKRDIFGHKGNPAFFNVASRAMIAVAEMDRSGLGLYSYHTPDRCNSKMGYKKLEFYTPPK